MRDQERLLTILRQGTDNTVSFLLATIPSGYTSGNPTLQFDGEDAATTRAYPHLSSYTPTAGDRVLVAVVNNGGVILGKVVSG